LNAECLRIADQLRRAFNGDPWHGSPLRDLLAGVPAEQALALPFTHKSVGANVTGWLRVSESEPFTHDLELRIALPYQLVTRRWIPCASQVSSDPRDKTHRVAQG